MLSDIRHRLRAIVHRRRVEQELDDELRFHLDRETEKYVAQGVPLDEARRRAHAAFGGVSGIKDDARDARGVAMLEHVGRDVRFALRLLRTRPMFTAVVVGTLALGVGVNAAMFGILDRTLFRPPRYLVDPATVNRVYVQWSESDGQRTLIRRVEYPRYANFAAWNRSLSQLAGFSYRAMGVGEGDDTKELQVGAVTGGFFDFFDARPVLGRFFGPREDTPPAGEAVAILGYGYWQSRYAGRRDVLGATITIGSRTYTIIGVAPRGFEGVSDHHSPVAFIPATAYAASLRPNYYNRYNWNWIEMLVRRKPHVSVAAATADLTNTFRQSWNAERAINPSTPSPETVRPTAIAGPIQLARGPMAGPETKVAVWIGGVALVVLLITCANVANLLLARTLVRKREMAVRRAIGGTGARLVQQLLTESLVLAVLGTIAGVAAAQLAAESLRRLLVDTDEAWPVVTDVRTIVFAVGLALIVTVLAGILPALHAGREAVSDSLRAGTRSGAYRQSRTRATLLAFQTALSVVLLVGAGLFVRSLQHVRALRLGYDVDPIVYVGTAMRGVKLTAVATSTLIDRLLTEARTVPGIASATVTISVPFLGSERHTLYVAGIDSVRKLGRFLMQAGSPEYFATMGTRILRGRNLSADDRAGTPRVAIVSEAMANVLWKSDEPIGKCFRIESDTLPCTTVVGVAENITTREITTGGEFMYYLPIAQYAATIGPPEGIELFVRTRGPATNYIEPLRARLQRLMPGASYVTVVPFHEMVDPAMRSWTSGARVFLTLGALALAVAAIGLYAVIAFAVTQRTHELGIRIALGALPSDVLRLVVGEGAGVTLVGVAIGAAVALAAAGQIESLLFRESPRDPAVFAVVALTLICVGILASAIPATRAARVDPNTALRTE